MTAQAERELDWETGRELERKDDEIARLRAALTKIRDMKPSPIGDSGFVHGPALLLSNCQRTARKALRGQSID